EDNSTVGAVVTVADSAGDETPASIGLDEAEGAGADALDGTAAFEAGVADTDATGVIRIDGCGNAACSAERSGPVRYTVKAATTTTAKMAAIASRRSAKPHMRRGRRPRDSLSSAGGFAAGAGAPGCSSAAFTALVNRSSISSGDVKEIPGGALQA